MKSKYPQLADYEDYYSAMENPKVPTNTPLPVFLQLDFDDILGSLHDDFVSRQWLMCRRIQTYKTVDKQVALENPVKQVVDLGVLKVFSHLASTYKTASTLDLRSLMLEKLEMNTIIGINISTSLSLANCATLMIESLFCYLEME
jgi:hypothetical protein